MSGDDQILGLKDPIFKYFLPRVIDSEGNTETVEASLERSPPCNCIKYSTTKSRVIEVDKRRVSAGDHGTWKMILEVTDD